MLRVVIESPLNPGVPFEHPEWASRLQENKVFARACILDSLARGEAPYASHIFFDQPGLLTDAIPAQRELGMLAGFAWGEKADLVAVYTDRGISDGMRRGIARALGAGQRVEYRELTS